MEVRKSFWTGRRVLVTGGSGFVGYWLASTLVKEGAIVSVLDIKPLPHFSVLEKNYRKNIYFKKGSITSKQTVLDLLKKRKIQTIFHLAAEAIVTRALENPGEALDTNIRGTWEILEAAREYPVEEIIIASSDKAYGDHATLPYKEEFALQGKYPYECSKSCTDLVAQMYAHTYGLPIAIARCGNIYGGGDMNGTRLIPDALHSLFSGKKFFIRSNGKFLRDYIYISDVVRSYMVMAELFYSKKLSGMAFNFANNQPLSVLQVLDLLQKNSDEKLVTKILNKSVHEIHDQYLDSTRARRLLSWKPLINHTKGFESTVKWYAEFFKKRGRLEK